MEPKVRAIDLKIGKDHLEVILEDGRIVFVPLAWYPRLLSASRKALKNFEWIGKGLGIHWPEIDEDLSVDGFLKAQKAPLTQFKTSKIKLKDSANKSVRKILPIVH
ncbi:MAG: DUF2442 domain-containing protein [Ignavibacteriota bacterium]